MYSSKTKDELIRLCKERNIKGYSGKKKDDIINLLNQNEKPVKTEVAVKTEKVSTDKLRLVDLFAGSGAFTLAFESTGKVECVYSNDMVKESKEIYDTNFSHKLTLGDLNDIDVSTIPSHDILTGGFPCQPFSIAGKREGFNDKRSNVFWKILEIIDYHNPKCIVLENVKNLVSHDDNKTFID